MEHDGNADYYLRREAKERELASKAKDPAASRIHTELAETYAAKARSADPRMKMPSA